MTFVCPSSQDLLATGKFNIDSCVTFLSQLNVLVAHIPNLYIDSNYYITYLPTTIHIQRQTYIHCSQTNIYSSLSAWEISETN